MTTNKNGIGQQELITELYHALSSFYSSTCTPRHTDEVKGIWIIDKKEKEAIKIVLDMLVDCGADDEFKNY